MRACAVWRRCTGALHCDIHAPRGASTRLCVGRRPQRSASPAVLQETPAINHRIAGLQNKTQLSLQQVCGSPGRSMAHGSTVCQGFVGENTAAAGAYYANDFAWEELRDDPGTVAALKRQAARVGQDNSVTEGRQDNTRGDRRRPTRATFQSQSSAWEAFHARDNATARFYKERRYLLLEFPQLAQQPPGGLHIVEIGCGCGSSLLPVLKANPVSRATATDVSPTAVTMCLQAAERAGIASDRLVAFAFDAAQPAPRPLAGLNADICIIIFTLAALEPGHMQHMLNAAWQALRPGGMLLIRDHGLLDITHLRNPALHLPQVSAAQGSLHAKVTEHLRAVFPVDLPNDSLNFPVLVVSQTLLLL